VWFVLTLCDRTGLGATFSSCDISRLGRFESEFKSGQVCSILVSFKFIQSVGLGMEDDCMMIFAPLIVQVMVRKRALLLQGSTKIYF